MTKILCVIISFLACLLSTQAYAAKIINLSPNESKSLTNNYLWTLNATCHIKCNGQTKNKIKVSILKNKGIVNGKNLSLGQTTSVTLKTNQDITVTAEPGTTVNLINVGTDSVQAYCST